MSQESINSVELLNEINNVNTELTSNKRKSNDDILPPSKKISSCDKTKTARRWCFTAFISQCPTPPMWNETKCTFLVYQREQCPTTGNIHWQGFVIFKTPVRHTGVQRTLAIGKSKCIIVNGTNEQNYDYCTKKETRIPGSNFTEYGLMPTDSGDRMDIRKFYLDTKDGSTECELWETHTECMIKYPQALQRIRNDFNVVKKRNGITMPITTVHWGPTGTGKSHSAMKEAIDYTGDIDKVYILRDYGSLAGATIWTGYNPMKHTAVIIDEFYGWAKWHELLAWLDKYPVQVRVHGAMVDLTCMKFWITSNCDPEQWYNKLIDAGKVKYETLQRRLTNIKHLAIKYIETE